MLGENIYKLRKEKKLSQEDLAQQLNVTRQTISNWELGETSPNPEQLKLLSKTLNISIDELLDNDIKNVIEEKVSNTEKLAGIIIKILKIIGIIFLILFIIDIIAFFIFTFVRKGSYTTVTEEASITCSINNSNYDITISSDEYFDCTNCSKEIENDIEEIIDYSDIDKTIEDIEEYFLENNGICK